MEQRGLAATARPDDPDPGVPRYLEVNPAQNDELAEPLADALEVDANVTASRRAGGPAPIAGHLGWHPTDPSGY
jgi:hypothetical protein